MFVEQWVKDWNAHDVEALLTHFGNDVVFTSPMAARFFGGDGVIQGKNALRHAWTEASVACRTCTSRFSASMSGSTSLSSTTGTRMAGWSARSLVSMAHWLKKGTAPTSRMTPARADVLGLAYWQVLLA